MSERPVDQEKAASAFYAALDMDVSYFPAIWHTYKVGHLLMTDLDRICRAQGLSMADIHMMGAVRVGNGLLRATDLAQTLHVSNAVLSARVTKLEGTGLIERLPCGDDRRAHSLKLTAEGIAKLDAAIAMIGEHAQFVKSWRRLSDHDRSELERIMGEFHNQLDREFISLRRQEG